MNDVTKEAIPAAYDMSIHHNPDAAAWARFYCEAFPEADEALMRGWFANAMMAMHDWQAQAHDTALTTARAEAEAKDAIILQLGENAAKAAAEYAEEVAKQRETLAVLQTAHESEAALIAERDRLRGMLTEAAAEYAKEVVALKSARDGWRVQFEMSRESLDVVRGRIGELEAMLNRVATALPVLETMLAAAGLSAGLAVAQELHAETRAALTEPSDG